MDKHVAKVIFCSYFKPMSNETSRKYIKTKFEGVFYRLSSKRNSKTGEADKIYAFWYADNEGKGHWKTVGRHSQGIRPVNARNARSQFLAEYNQTGINPALHGNFTVGQAVEAYYIWAEHEGKQIRNRYLSYNAQMRKHIHNIPVADITPGFLTQLKGHLLKCPLARSKSEIKRGNKIIHKERKIISPGAVKGLFIFVRAAVNRAIYNGLWKGVNPFSTKEGWEMPKVNNKRLRFLTREEAKALLEDLELRHPQLHDMVLLSLRTGLRPTEIFRLKGEDVDGAANVLYVLAKGARRVPVKVPAEICQMLLAYGRKPHETIFQSEATGKAFIRTPGCFQTAVRKLGLAPEDGNSLYAITLHTMRHTFASWLAQSGKVSIMELQKLMRHESIDMTMRYAHLFPGQESEKLSIIGDILS